MHEELSIGRDEDNDIVIPHPYLSGRHALLSVVDREAMRFRIRDMGTTNGTYKNGQRVEEAEFSLQDTIKVAGSTLEPSVFMPLFFGDSSAESEPLKGKGKKGKSRKGSRDGDARRPGSSMAGLVMVLAMLPVAFGLAYPLSGRLDTDLLVQTLSVWALLALLLQLALEIQRNRGLLVAEKQYRDIMLEQWQRKMDAILKSRHEDLSREREGWSGFRKFEIAKRVEEARDIVSFYLTPHDKKALPVFRPGQYLTFRLEIPGQDKPVIRCYSLSDRYHEDYYRVSIKRVPAPPGKDCPPGVSSNFFHDHLKTGSIVDVKAPSGKFYLNEQSDAGVVLIAGGVGITPMISMLNTLTESGSKREIWFFYGVRNSAELAMKKHLKSIDELFDNVHLHLCFSDPLESDEPGVDFHHAGRVSVDLFRTLLPSNNFEYYMCGPPPMMQGVTEALAKWGVPDKDVHFEAFGPASVKKKKPASPETGKADSGRQVEVEFVKSGKKLAWDASCESILEFAENHGIEMACGCRAGNCGTCQVAVRQGKVGYTSEHDIDIEAGSCLACIAVPDGNIALDA